MTQNFEMVAKTFQGLEDVLAKELMGLGADRVRPGRRMVQFEGDLEMLYKANLCCRTALRILKPFWRFTAETADELYERVKEFDWGSIMTVNSTFAIDTVAYSDRFTHSRYVTYRVKDAIVDWFQDRHGEGKRPGVRLEDADVMVNVHINGDEITLSLDSSGESLHKRGYRVAQTEAPINEVLAAGIILRSGWRGDSPLVDPMCGSGTFLVEAALIAANINPGVYRRHFAFETWKDFDAELFDRLYNDDSGERTFDFKIYGSDISPKAVDIARRNIQSAGVARMVELEVKPLSAWTEAPAEGVMVTNPPYGERISVADMEGLYQLIGTKLKNVFKGYHAWIIASKNDYVAKIGLSPSVRIPVFNGSIECELREYVIFEGDYKTFRSQGGRLRDGEAPYSKPVSQKDSIGRKPFDRKERPGRKPFEGKPSGDRPFGRKPFGKNDSGRKPFDRERKPFDRRDEDYKPFGRKPGSFRDGRPENDERTSAERRRDRREFFAKAPRNKLEERYRPGRPGDKPFRKPDSGPRNHGSAPQHAGNAFRKPEQEVPKAGFPVRKADAPLRPEPPENPLALRRSEEALKTLVNKQPSLPPMRSRRKKEE